jgi:hypothetical protein
VKALGWHHRLFNGCFFRSGMGTVVKYINRLFVIALFFLPMTTVTSAKSKASLDKLVSRVDSYWKLLLEGKKHEAAAYLVPSKREDFLARPFPSFSNPRLKSLELSKDRTEAKITVIVRRPVPIPFDELDWPVKEKWIFENKNWYLLPETASIPIQSGAATPSTQFNAEHIEAVKRELQQMLRFEKSVLDFGTVNRGTAIVLKIGYSLAGNEPLAVTVRGSALGLRILGLNGQSLLPGQMKEIAIEMKSVLYDGDVKEQIDLVFKKQGVEVPFEFTVKGHVYVPASVVPRLVQFDLKGEREKTILVRNNSKEILKIKSLFSETDAVRIESLPATILPGQEAQLKVKWIRDVDRSDLRDNLTLSFAQPVDGMAALGLTVVFNPSKKKNHDAGNPDEGIYIQDLIHKNQINLPKPQPEQ